MSTVKNSSDVAVYRKDALKAARDLNYPLYVIQQLKAATTLAQIERIMITARKENNY